MNERNECEIPNCDNEAHQVISLKSKLLFDNPPEFEAGDLWHGRQWGYMCRDCAEKLFAMYDKFYDHGDAGKEK